MKDDELGINVISLNLYDLDSTDVEAATEIGCYKDASVRALNAIWLYSTGMTVEKCQMICAGNVSTISKWSSCSR